MEISCFNFHMSPFQCLSFDKSHNGCATQFSVQWPCLSPSLIPERPLTLQNLCLEGFKKHRPLQYGIIMIINIQSMLLYLLLIFWFLSEPKPNHFHIFPSSLFLSPQALAHSLSYKMLLSLLLLEVKHAFYFYSTISHILLYGIYLVARCIC